MSEELKKRISEAYTEQLNLYTEFKKAEKKYCDLRSHLESTCEHKWEVDPTTFDYNHTCFRCVKCEAQR